MNIWIAGNTGIEQRESMVLSLKGQRLMSYYFIAIDFFNCQKMLHVLEEQMKKQKDPEVELFLDSGAFSAHTQGVKIDLDEYIQFIKEHEDVISVYANLDVIRDAEATLENQTRMEEAGLSPLPCFHIGEPLRYLKRYIDEYDYIAIGGMLAIGTSSDVVAKTLDSIFSEYICDENGIPKVKVHGFGLTSLKLMCRYPWYSVDSTSWIVTGRMGSVYVPKPWAHALDDCWKICVSTRSPSKKQAGKHIDTLPPGQLQHVLDYFESKGFVLGKSKFVKRKAGYKPKKNERPTGKVKNKKLAVDQEVEVLVEPGLCNDYRARDQLNVMYFRDLERAMPEWPQPFTAVQSKEGFDI